MRVLPLENEAINECWLSDRDRFSYEALNSEERLTAPMIKHDGVWHTVDWSTALDYVVRSVRDVIGTHGPDAVGAFAASHSTVEELYVLRKLLGELGVRNIDTRLRQADFRGDSLQKGALWLGSSITEFAGAGNVLLIGSDIRSEQPLLAHRLRQAVRRGGALHVINHTDTDLLCKVASRQIVAPQALLQTVVAVASAAEALKAGTLGSGAAAEQAELLNQPGTVIVLGEEAQNHPDFALILEAAQRLAAAVGGRVSVLPSGANSVGAWVAGAHPAQTGGRNAASMLDGSLKAAFLLHAEAEDFNDPARMHKALQGAGTVIVLSPFKHATDYADVLLPIAPWTETAGTFINMEGRVQSFNGVVKPLGETRPAWKVLRVLGNLLQLPGFAYESAEDIRAEALLNRQENGFVRTLDNGLSAAVTGQAQAAGKLMRIGTVPLYGRDGIVRRSPSLQKTAAARSGAARVNPQTLKELGLQDDAEVSVRQGEAMLRTRVSADERVAVGGVQLGAAVGGLFDAITIEGV